MQEDSEKEPLNRPLMVLIALIQGLLLFWLKEALMHEFWPHDVRVAEVLLWAVCLSVPVLILLSLNRHNQKSVFLGALCFAFIVALTSAYTGWQLEPNENVIAPSLLWIFVFTQILLLFKVAMYLQIMANREQFTYNRLFVYSWRNCILIALCLLFVLVFGGILFLWAALFSLVGIDFFSDIFEEDWFLFPILALANGLAFSIFRQLVGILDTMSRVLRALCQFLLPVLAFVSVLFLICLPFVGFSALWDTGRGTALVLWLQALTLFFVNATFQGDEDQDRQDQDNQDQDNNSPYWPLVQKLVYLGILVLPIYSLIAIYGMWLRIDQYGLTVARLWALVVVGLLGLFAISYTLSLIMNRAKAIGSFGWINVRLGLVLLGFMVLVNSPLLDFRKMTVKSQLAMFNSGEIKAENLDVRYFARELGRPGYLALEALKADADEALRKRIERAQLGYAGQAQTMEKQDIEARIFLHPETAQVPEQLMARLLEQETHRRDLDELHIISRDLNADGNENWITLRQATYGYINAELWQLKATGWHQTNMQLSRYDIEDLGQLISKSGIKVEEPKWKVLEIGDLVIRYSE